MKKLLTILFIFLAACSAQVSPEEPAATVPPVAPSAAPQEAIGLETAEAYPAQPAAESLPGDYPSAPADTPPEAYPAVGEAGLVWVIRSEGVQCETNSAPTGEKGLQQAVESLAAAGITAEAWELTEMMVTAVCGSPTSTHYLVQIPAAELDKAVALGWAAQ